MVKPGSELSLFYDRARAVNQHPGSCLPLFLIIENRKQHQHLLVQDKLNELVSGILSRSKFHQLQLMYSNEKHA